MDPPVPAPQPSTAAVIPHAAVIVLVAIAPIPYAPPTPVSAAPVSATPVIVAPAIVVGPIIAVARPDIEMKPDARVHDTAVPDEV